MQRLSQTLFTRAPLILVLLLILGLPVLFAQSPPTISISPVSADEGDAGTTTTFTFNLTRSGDTTDVSSVNFTTIDQTATAGDDYVTATGTVTFEIGETDQTIQVMVNGDDDFEPSEIFLVSLSGEDNATLSVDQAQGFIINDDDEDPDTPGLINIVPTEVGVTEGGSTAVVKFTLDTAPAADVRIDLTPDSECSVVPTTVIFRTTNNNWETGVNVTISAINDTLFEGEHNCLILVSNSESTDPVYNDIDLPDIRATITDNDGTPDDDDDDGGSNPSPTPIDVSSSTATPTTPTPIIPTSTPAPTATSAVPSMARVSGEVRGLALRTGPYLGATLIGSADAGFEYPILARSHDEGGEYTWFLIQVGEVQGWVSGRFLNFNGLEELLPVQGSIFDQVDGAPDIGVFGTTFSINDLRRRPSGRAQIITQIPADTRVSIIGRTRQNGGDFWYQVRYSGLVGWIPAFVDRGDTSRVPIR